MPDVIVVGGGPVGLAAAIAARQSGLEVLVLEPRRPPIDKPCGEGLMPASLVALAALGVPAAALGGREFVGLRFVEERPGGDPIVVEGSFGLVPPAALGVRRVVLHDALVHRAQALGVELRWGVRAVGLERLRATHRLTIDDGSRRETLETGFVVGADGLHSKVRGWVGLARPRSPRANPPRFGMRRHYAIAPWTDHVEVHWSDLGEAYVTPVDDACVGVALLAARGDLAALRKLEPFPLLRARLGAAPAVTEERGAGPFRQATRGVIAEGVALVGDAAGYLDPIAGEGLAIGFDEALALGSALARDDPRAYARSSRRLRRIPEAITRLLLAAHAHPALRRASFRALARRPALFGWILRRAVGDGARERQHDARASRPGRDLRVGVVRRS